MPPDGAVAPYELASVDLLSQQPVARIDDGAPGENWGELFPLLESRLAGLRVWRYSWWQHWASLAEQFLPRRYHWLIVGNSMSRGLPINTSIVDSTAAQALRICAAGMWSGLTSPTRPWFKLGIGLPWMQLDNDGKAWLEDTEQRLYYVFSQSNFYNVMAQAFQDVAGFGTAPVIMYEDAETVFRCYLPCAGEYYLQVGARLDVDTLYREFTLTVQQIVDMFQVENCPHQVLELWQRGGSSLEMEFVVAHAIEPNTAVQRRGWADGRFTVVPGGFAYREIYWLKGIMTTRELSRRGFRERPFFVARWAVTSNDAYGRSPGMDCLGDSKQLQMETRRKAEFIEKLIRPPMGGNLELKNEPASILPGHITYTSTADGKKGFWPLYEVSPGALAPLVEDIKEVQLRIEKCFFVDVFMAISQMEGVQPRNELELTKRDLERLQVLGPFVNLFETECAGPAIMRALAILQRRKLVKPMPASLQNVPLKIDFVSMMSVAQSASANTAIATTIAQAMQFSQGAKESGAPDPLDTIDLDVALQTMADNVSFPVKALRSTGDVAKLRAQRQEAAQQANQAQVAPAAVSAAKTLSETNPNQGALGQILGAH